MEVVKDIVKRGDNLIIHIGRKDIESTKFTVYSKDLAIEVRDILEKFINGSIKY